MNLQVCRECDAIARDFVEACRAVGQDMREDKCFSGPEFVKAVRTATTMQTETDVVTSESFFAQSPLKHAPLLGRAIQRKYTHEVLTGHKVSLPGFRKH